MKCAYNYYQTWINKDSLNISYLILAKFALELYHLDSVRERKDVYPGAPARA